MIKHTFLLFLILFSIQSVAQEYRGQLVDNDGSSKEVSFLNPYKKSNYESILYLHYGMPHELHAKYFIRAEFSDEIIYASINVEEFIEKVWAQVHFESKEVKLFLRYNKYYLEINKKVVEISKYQNLESLELPEKLKILWKQTQENSKALPFKKVKTLLKNYHKQESIEYKSYFNTPQSIPYIEFGVALISTKANINKSNNEQVDVNILSPRLFANCRIYFPRVMKNSFASFGISAQRYSLNKDTHQKTTNGDNYYESEIKFFQVAIPLAFNMKITSKNNFNIYAKAGIKIYYNIGSDGSLNTEYKIDNIVRPQSFKLQLAKESSLAPIAGFLIDKKFGKHQFSLSLQYEHYMESGANSPEVPEIELSNPAFTIGLAMKF